MRAIVAKVDLEGVYKVTAKGKTYVYAWRGKGAPRIIAPEGSREFQEELAQHLQNHRIGPEGKMKALCARWRASDAWASEDPEKGLSASTKRNWRRFLDAIQVEFGDLSVRQFDRVLTIRPRIKRWLATYNAHPRQRDMAKQVLSALLSFAVEDDKLTENPCLGIPNIYRVDRSDRIWSADDLARLKAKAPAHVYNVAMLGALTGLRQTDLLNLAWSHVGDLAIEIRTGKSKGKKTAVIPLYTELKAFLKTIKETSTVVLVSGDGVPYETGFGTAWRKTLIKAGFLVLDEDGKVVHDANLHFHDLRGTAATRMYLGGLSIREIAEIFTWGEDDVERLIDRYVKRDEILLDKIRRLDLNTKRTPAAKPLKNRSAKNA